MGVAVSLCSNHLLASRAASHLIHPSDLLLPRPRRGIDESKQTKTMNTLILLKMRKAKGEEVGELTLSDDGYNKIDQQSKAMTDWIG